MPEKLMARLAEYFRSFEFVEGAYLGEVYVPSSGQRDHLMVGVRLAENFPGKFEEVLPRIGPIVREVFGERELIDSVPLKGSVANLKLFYSRQAETQSV